MELPEVDHVSEAVPEELAAAAATLTAALTRLRPRLDNSEWHVVAGARLILWRLEREALRHK